MEPRTPKPHPGLTRFLIAAVLAISGFSSVFIIFELTAFDQTAGAADPAPRRWPGSSRLPRSAGRPDLLVFVHPFCSCTLATFDELARVPAKRKRHGLPPVLHIVFEGPVKNAGPGGPDLWNKAQALADAMVTLDRGGREAQLFGARTSGYTLLYSARGDLMFRGGVTGSRGHQGDNKGLEQLVNALDAEPGSEPRRIARTFVFGCALASSAAWEKVP